MLMLISGHLGLDKKNRAFPCSFWCSFHYFPLDFSCNMFSFWNFLSIFYGGCSLLLPWFFVTSIVFLTFSLMNVVLLSIITIAVKIILKSTNHFLIKKKNIPLLVHETTGMDPYFLFIMNCHEDLLLLREISFKRASFSFQICTA